MESDAGSVAMVHHIQHERAPALAARQLCARLPCRSAEPFALGGIGKYGAQPLGQSGLVTDREVRSGLAGDLPVPRDVAAIVGRPSPRLSATEKPNPS